MSGTYLYQTDGITSQDLIAVAKKHGARITPINERGISIVVMGGLTFILPMDDRYADRQRVVHDTATELAYILLRREVEAVRQSTTPADSPVEGGGK